MKKAILLVPGMLLVCFLVLFLKADLSQAGDDIWTTTGPYGVRIYGLAIAPNNSQVLYAATPDGVVNVYKSVDGGTTWQPKSQGIPEGVWAVGFVFDPQDPQTTYVATEQGVYKSTDGGESWVLKSEIELDGERKVIPAWSIAVSPLDGTLYLGAYDAGFSNRAPGGIYRSKDGGDTWEQLGNGAPTRTVRALAVAPSAPHIVYAGTHAMTEGVFRSTDGGDTWQPINSGFGAYPDIWCLTVDPSDSQSVYMGTSNDGLYKTNNGGQTWTPIGTGLSSSVHALTIDSGNQQIIYAGTGGGVYRSMGNNGEFWQPMFDGMGSRSVFSLALDGNDPRTLYAGSNSGVWQNRLVSGFPPVGLTISDGALFTNQTAVTLTLTAPPGASEMIVSNDGSFGTAFWEPVAKQKDWILEAYGEHVLPRIVYAKFKVSGSESGLFQDDIVLDMTPPTGMVEITGTSVSSVDMNSPAITPPSLTVAPAVTSTVHLPILYKNARPGFRLIGLRLAAQDDLSGVDAMMIGNNDPSLAGATWLPYAESTEWWVPAGVGAVVYVQFRDRAGNVSEVFSDTVTR